MTVAVDRSSGDVFGPADDEMSVGTASTAGMTTVTRSALKAEPRYGGIPEAGDEGRNPSGRKSKKGRVGRGRSALKSMGRSVRSRSSFRSSSKKDLGDGADEKKSSKSLSKKAIAVEPSAEKQRKKRSRTRSPLRKAAEAVKVASKAIKPSKSKSKKRFSSDGSKEASVSLVGSVSTDEGLDQTLLTRCLSVSEHTVVSEGGDSFRKENCVANDASSLAPSVVSTESADTEAGPSTPLWQEHATPLLPSLVPEPEQEIGPAFEVSLVESAPKPLAPFLEVQVTETTNATEVKQMRSVPSISSLIEVVDLKGDSKARARKEKKRAKRDRAKSVVEETKQKVKNVKKPTLTLKKQASLQIQKSALAQSIAPTGLASRRSSRSIASQLKAGPAVSEAVRSLREHQSGLTRKSSFKKPHGKYSFFSVAGLKIPDYAGYIENSVAAFRKTIGVSDREFEGIKEGAMGWVYSGREC